MPGGSDSFDLLRTKDRQSNSKADTFFINPKGVGSAANQVQQFHTEAINGNVTGGTRVENLAGANLSISGGSLQAATGAPAAASYVTTQSESGLSNETVASDLVAVYGSPVPVGGNLQIPLGGGVEGAGGTARFRVLSDTDTRVDPGNGDIGIELKPGAANRINAQSNTPFTVFDREGLFTGVQYDADPTAGVLRTPNAGLVVESDAGFDATDNGVNIRFDSGGDRAVVQSRVNGSDGLLQLRSDITEIVSGGELVDLSPVGGADLRLATGQRIEDGGGTSRMVIREAATDINDENGNDRLSLRDGSSVLIKVENDTPLKLFDESGGFTSVQYNASTSSPGTLKLTNAMLDFQAGQASTTNDSMTANPESQTEDGFIEVEISGSRFQIPAYSP